MWLQPIPDVLVKLVSFSWHVSVVKHGMVIYILDSYQPGTSVTLHMYYIDTGDDMEVSMCPSCQTYRSHTQPHCPLNHHLLHPHPIQVTLIIYSNSFTNIVVNTNKHIFLWMNATWFYLLLFMKVSTCRTISLLSLKFLYQTFVHILSFTETVCSIY